jgi:hypothetical protein
MKIFLSIFNIHGKSIHGKRGCRKHNTCKHRQDPTDCKAGGVDVSVLVAGVSFEEAVFMEVSVPPGCAGFDAWDAR